MRRDYEVYLTDVLTAAGKVREYVGEMDLEELASDARTLDAVIRNLEVIGEAVKHLPADVRARSPETEWQKIAGLRDILIHQYFGVDVDIVWDVVKNKLPALETTIHELLS